MVKLESTFPHRNILISTPTTNDSLAAHLLYIAQLLLIDFKFSYQNLENVHSGMLPGYLYIVGPSFIFIFFG